MRNIRVSSCAILLLTASLAAYAVDGRYQAVALKSGYEFGTEKALLIDTVAGHVWVWVESPAVGDKPGGRYVIYQGQLLPGREMGDIIHSQEWPSADTKPK